MLAGLAVSIEFLGLLDTCSFCGGGACFTGRCRSYGMGRSCLGRLPDERQFPGLIKCCRHFVAAHEQRLCFPLDSIRRPDGNYPLNAEEIIYPGMHSDVGGGYPVRDQGKSCW